ncbi:hypothetical protein [Nostoc sp. LEGE 06077]|uniref:hypothetical protein n=1 Tax=Nostoc sp. LEGE 06077 TaxID=915325 RepID=UPI00188142A2|nr:hypothetical protein [Nostoc sp. LEGE 06077]
MVDCKHHCREFDFQGADMKAQLVCDSIPQSFVRNNQEQMIVNIKILTNQTNLSLPTY